MKSRKLYGQGSSKSWLKISCFFFILVLTSFSDSSNIRAQNEVGLIEGMLKPCPNSPNCVSSTEKRKIKSIDPIEYTCSFQEAREIVIDVMIGMGGELITDERIYLHFEVATSLGNFKDDVEVVFEELDYLDIKSASRVGYGDFGANRRRLRRFSKKFKAAEIELLQTKAKAE